MGNPAAGGSYFRRFPTPAARRSHSSMSYTDRSPLTSRCMTSRPYRPWRRTPAATQVTVYDIDHVNVEQSQEGSVGSSRKGIVVLCVMFLSVYSVCLTRFGVGRSCLLAVASSVTYIVTTFSFCFCELQVTRLELTFSKRFLSN